MAAAAMAATDKNPVDKQCQDKSQEPLLGDTFEEESVAGLARARIFKIS